MKRYYVVIMVIVLMFVVRALSSFPTLADGGSHQIFLPGIGSAPPESTILFTRNGDLFKINADGTNLQNLTANIDDLISIYYSWSPDGRFIAFKPNFTSSIYVMQADGTNLHPVFTTSGIIKYGFQWSPDSENLSFNVTNNNENDIYVVNRGGDMLVNVTNRPSIEKGYHRWSPDSTMIAYGEHIQPPSSAGNLVVTTVKNSQNTILEANFARFSTPEWSPDSNSIFYTCQNGNQYDGCIENIATGVSRTVNPTGIRPVHVNWRSDGQALAFIGTNTNIPQDGWRVYRINVSNEQPTNELLRHHPFEAGKIYGINYPKWSYDNGIYYGLSAEEGCSETGCTDYKTWVYSVGGESPFEIENYLWPDLSPDGGKYAMETFIYDSSTGNFVVDVVKMSLSGELLQTLTNDGASNVPLWQPIIGSRINQNNSTIIYSE